MRKIDIFSNPSYPSLVAFQCGVRLNKRHQSPIRFLEKPLLAWLSVSLTSPNSGHVNPAVFGEVSTISVHQEQLPLWRYRQNDHLNDKENQNTHNAGLIHWPEVTPVKRFEAVVGHQQHLRFAKCVSGLAKRHGLSFCVGCEVVIEFLKKTSLRLTR